MMEMKSFIPEKAGSRFEPYEDMFKTGVEDADGDVGKLQYLAYNPPAGVPANLAWYWAGRVMSIIARVSMHGRVDLNKGMSSFKVWDVLRTSLSEEQLAMGLDELRSNLITSLSDRMRFLMNRPPLMSFDHCKHQKWIVRKLGGSSFCQTCTEHERNREAELALLQTTELADNKDVRFISKGNQEQVVSAGVSLEEVGASGSMKRKMDNEVEISVKQQKKD